MSSNPNMDDEGRVWKWAIEPHPYSDGDYDIFVTNDDREAREAILAAAESIWDGAEDGETKTVKVTLSEHFH